MIRVDIRESVGQYLSKMMEIELTHFLGRKPYERKEEDTNHRNGSYDRSFTLKPKFPTKKPDPVFSRVDG